MNPRTCKTPGCQKLARRKGMCAAHYQKQYRTDRAAREAVAARADAVCVVPDCGRTAEKKGLCHACYNRNWTAEQRLKVGSSVTASRDNLEEVWLIVREGIPVREAAGLLGLRVDGPFVASVRTRAAAEGVDLDEIDRGYAVAKKWVDRKLRAELQAEIGQGLSIEDAARKLGIGNLDYARRLTA